MAADDDAGDFWVAVEAGLANTDRPVICDVAPGVQAAAAWVAADGVYARGWVATFVVAFAA